MEGSGKLVELCSEMLGDSLVPQADPQRRQGTTTDFLKDLSRTWVSTRRARTRGKENPLVAVELTEVKLLGLQAIVAQLLHLA